MARALQDILTELNSVYQPQKDLYNSQIGTLDPQLQAEQQGLQAQKQDSFQQITDQANRRGLFYSGLPIQEEQRYTGQQFLPALANLQSKYATQRFGLQDALAKITAQQYGQGQDIYQKEVDRDAEMARFNAQLAAQERSSAASRAASGGPGGINLPLDNTPVITNPLAAGVNQTNPYGEGTYVNWVQKLRQLRDGGLKWGDAAYQVEQLYGKIPAGSSADKAFQAVFAQRGGATTAGRGGAGGGGGGF